MKFDYCIGNPPFNDDFDKSGDNGYYAAPVYNKFLDEAYKIADVVEMIHPARFLFNAGSTPKGWNEKMLKDEHLKILFYEADSSKVFSNTDIKGGVAVSYRNNNMKYGAIDVFTPYIELNSIINKVKHNSERSFSEIVFSAYSYHFSDALHNEHPNVKYKEKDGKNIGVLSKGHDYDLKSNVLEKMPGIFTEEKQNDDDLLIVGRINGNRGYRFINRAYIEPFTNLDFYKVFVPKANAAGKYGEPLAQPFLGTPSTGSTETFLSIGKFENSREAENVIVYIRTKFFRALLGALKVTQDLTPGKMALIPLQDFTSDSDIDWTRNINEIDQQLYRKYNLDDKEIEFIETHVKEMK